MNRVRIFVCLLAVGTLFSCGIAWAGTIAVGYVSWDITAPGSAGEFDVQNQTGPNSSIFPDTTFPVSSPLNFSSLSLSVMFSDGSTQVFGSSDFTLIGDGLSYNGPIIPIGGTNPLPTSAALTGDFSPLTITLNDGSTVTIDPTFSATISVDPGNATLVDGDLAVIYATTSTGGTPEPGTWLLAATGVLGLMVVRYRRSFGGIRAVLRKAIPFAAKTGAIVLCLVVAGSAFAAPPAVHLNVWTSPDNGVAGINNVNVTASGVPSGTITPKNAVVTIATACGGTVAATTSANSVITVVGTSKRFNFSLPSTLRNAAYFVTIADSVAGDADFTSGNCSEVKVTHTSTTVSCLPSSSLGVSVPTSAGTVTAYVPNGCWDCGGTGLQSVVIEPTPALPTSISTANTVNSCSATATEAVCVANNTDIYLISVSGNTLTTLTSGSTGFVGFSGGSCENCGVSINPLSNTAYINMGFSGAPSGSGIQSLNLSTNAFGTPVPATNIVSEDISIDPTDALVLSPGEGGSYDLYQIGSGGSLTEFSNFVGGAMDSAAEDCSTHIGLASIEFSNSFFIVDLTQAKFTPGSPGTWTAPSQTQTMTSSYGFTAGTDGISVAPGTSHLAVITGEFGGNTFAVLQLPSTSGSGTPAIADYAVAQIPSLTACGGAFNSGKDPHTVTAYTSPNDGKAYALFADSPPPSCVVKIDLAAVLAAPRNKCGILSAHDVCSGDFPAGAAVGIATH